MSAVHHLECDTHQDASETAHQLRCAGVPVGISGRFVIVPNKPDELAQALPDVESRRNRIELAKVIFHLRQAGTKSRRDIANAAAMASSPYSVGSVPIQSGKTGTIQEILNAFKAYLS